MCEWEATVVMPQPQPLHQQGISVFLRSDANERSSSGRSAPRRGHGSWQGESQPTFLRGQLLWSICICRAPCEWPCCEWNKYQKFKLDDIIFFRIDKIFHHIKWDVRKKGFAWTLLVLFIFLRSLCLTWQLSFMGLNRLEDGEEEEQNGVAADGYLPQDAWHGLARRAECCFRTAPTFHYMWATRRLPDQPWPKLKDDLLLFLFTALPPRFFLSHEVAVYLSNRLREDFNL